MSDAVSHSLTGSVTFTNLAAVRAAGEAAIAAAGERAVVDLSGLTDGNSAAVAVLVSWYRHAQGLGKDIVFLDAPAEVRNIIGLSGLSRVLPLESRAPEAATAGVGG